MNEQQVRHIVREVLKEYISAGGLDRIEDYADSMFNPIGVDIEFSRHFLDRLNDPRNIIDIESYEMKDLFKKLYNKYGQKIPNLKKGQGIEADVTDTTFVSESINSCRCSKSRVPSSKFI